jgi:WD40 repeat protein
VNVKVDRKNPGPDGRMTHFISSSEDGLVCIWDSRLVEKEAIRNTPDFIWKPFQQITLFRPDGSGDLGLARILLYPKQTTTTFWAASDEGDLVYVDWSIKPPPGAGGNAEEAAKFAEYVRKIYECERNYRPIVALERSPYYEDLILTVHDFHFCIWKISLDDFNGPIFRSANTFGSHNTCGAFSPTRPGVIFITKTDGIDVWDFIDQSNKPSLTLNFATSAITYFKFQFFKQDLRKQYMAYGDEADGTLFLYEVPLNLKNPQEKELDTIEEFW